MHNRTRRIVIRILLRILLVALIVVGSYIAYVFMTYHRLPDSAEQHSERTVRRVQPGQEYTAVTWNLGFGAYSRDFSFFMDGGEESRARSAQAVYDNLTHCMGVVEQQSADFILLQELDRKADRSWRIDEIALVREIFPDKQSYYAQNYNSAYLLYPITHPHGASKSGMLTLSDRDLYRAERRSLPVETNWRKLLDLDRCYTVCHIPTTDDRELCLFNLHLSAYTADESVATAQLKMLLDHIKQEYDKGNYVVAGGDFNRDLLGNAGEVFGVSVEGLSWTRPIERDLFPEGVRLVESLDPASPVPSCRNCDTGYIPGQTAALIVDGFIVSDNVDVSECRVIDEDFLCSDHNPVRLTFRLKEPPSEPAATEPSERAAEPPEPAAAEPPEPAATESPEPTGTITD